MNVSIWLVAALVLIPAVQVPLVLYLSKYVAVEESELPPLASSRSVTPREWIPDEERPGAAGDVARCSRCGIENEPGYRFCRQCTAPL